MMMVMIMMMMMDNTGTAGLNDFNFSLFLMQTVRETFGRLDCTMIPRWTASYRVVVMHTRQLGISGTSSEDLDLLMDSTSSSTLQVSSTLAVPHPTSSNLLTTMSALAQRSMWLAVFQRLNLNVCSCLHCSKLFSDGLHSHKCWPVSLVLSASLR